MNDFYTSLLDCISASKSVTSKALSKDTEEKQCHDHGIFNVTFTYL